MWPANEYATLCAEFEWDGYDAQAFSLEELIEELLPQLEEDSVLPGVFYTPGDKGITPTVAQLIGDLEDELPDSLAGNLQRQYLVPEFKKGNYSKGIADTVDAYIRTIEQRASGAATPTPAAGERRNGGFPAFNTFCCLAIIFIIFLEIKIYI